MAASSRTSKNTTYPQRPESCAVEAPRFVMKFNILQAKYNKI